MTFQERNGTYGMKQEHSGWNLAEKFGTDWDLKRDKILFCFILFFELIWNVLIITNETERNWQDEMNVVQSF